MSICKRSSRKTFGKESPLKKTLTVTGQTFKVNSYCVFEDADWYRHILIGSKMLKLEHFKMDLQEFGPETKAMQLYCKEI